MVRNDSSGVAEMTLGQKQRLFTRLIGQLIEFAYQNGYELTMGDGYRDPRVFGDVGTPKGYGNAESNHKVRLAHDFNLFRDGEYLTKTHHHTPLGLYWESLHPLCVWGGHFQDGNHYSLEHNGNK